MKKYLLPILTLLSIAVPVYALTVIDNFNSYTTGNLTGQGGWSGITDYQVTTTAAAVYEGANGVSCHSAGSGTINLTVTAQTSNFFSAEMKVSGTNREDLVLRDAGVVRAREYFADDGNIDFVSSIGTTVVGTYGTGWNKLDEEIDVTNNKVRGRANGGAWSAWETPTGLGSMVQIDSIQLNCDNNTGTSYYDYITYGTTSTPPPPIPPFLWIIF